MTVLIDSGTTSCWVARALADRRRLTIVTNNLEVAGDMLGRDGIRVFLAGGAVNVDYRATFDAEAIRDASRGQLAAYKVPRRVVRLDELPKSLIGKVLRREVRDRLIAAG